MLTDTYIDFDATNDLCTIRAGDGRHFEGITLDTRITRTERRLTDAEWTERVDMHLRHAASLARGLHVSIRYNQLWCEQRARQIGASYEPPEPDPSDDTVAIDTIASILNQEDQWSSDEIEYVAQVIEAVRGTVPGASNYYNHGKKLLPFRGARYVLEA